MQQFRLKTNWRCVARLSIGLTVGALLTGCGLLRGDGDDDQDTSGRIPVMQLEQTLTPDPRFAGVEISLPPPYVNRSWSQPEGEADHTLHHLEASGPLEVVWRKKVGAGASRKTRITAQPIYADNRIFVYDAEARVIAVDPETGRRIWRKDLAVAEELDRGWNWRPDRLISRPDPADLAFGGGLAFEDGRVFAVTGQGIVYALDAETGDEIWRFEMGETSRTAPTAYRGSVLVLTNRNRIFALNAADGTIRWDFQALEETTRILAPTSPAVADDVVAAPFSSGEIVALRLQNGRAVWSESLSRTSRMTALSDLNDVAGSPVIDRGRVYAIAHSGRMVSIDLRSGQTVWEASISSVQTPWVAGDYIYVVTTGAELVCLSRRDGAIVWVSQLREFRNQKKRKGRIVWSRPLLLSDRLVLTSSRGRMLMVSPTTGEILSERKVLDGSFVPPIVANETLYILSDEGKLAALR